MICQTCGVSHDALKLSPTWSSLDLVGYQQVPADETGPAEVYECRNAKCGSTLLRLVENATVAA